MHSTLVLLGRQPAFGIAELENLYRPDMLSPFGAESCLVSLPYHDINFDRLGGAMRGAEVLTTLPSSQWAAVETYLTTTVAAQLAGTEGKVSFGVSVYGIKINAQKLAKSALQLKKAIKQQGVSVRMVPHTSLTLGSATVLYNKLTAVNGREFLVVSDGTSTVIARTRHIQDIDAYAARDHARPYRDAKVGMLPPKLAQTIINLAVPPETEINPSQDPLLLLDPFCGTGVVLQEAMLMDYNVYGTDLEPRMVQYSIDNLGWLDEQHPDKGDYRRIEIGDATTHVWHNAHAISAVAGETYLGQPLSALPSSEHLSKIMYEVNLLHHKFLLNIAPQLSSGTRLCLAVPTWRGTHEFLHLPMLDHLTEMGYTRMRFTHVDDKDLIYHRENQVVGRELLVIQKR